jgi:hypothetical protein
MKRMAFVLAFSLGTLMALATGPAGAAVTSSTSYDIPAATATPAFACTDIGCGPLVTYSYLGPGTCSANCLGYPPSPVDVTLKFSVARIFPPSPCMMKSGTGTLDASWPNDPSLPTNQGTFTFKAQDSHVADFSGSISASSLAALPVGEALGGYVTFPPNPCTGGTAQAGLSFGG